MLTGEFGTIALTDVFVDRANRIRRQLSPTGLADLVESVRTHGLMHPIVLHREGNTLIAGENRLEAFRALGYTHIPFQYAEDLDESERLALEFEENVKRSDLPWQDRCDALLKLHELKLAADPTWTVTDTAKAVGFSQSSISAQLLVARKIASGDVKVSAAKDYSVAKGIAVRQQERAQADELIDVAPDPSAAPILTADFTEWVTDYAGPPFNLIHCDFPYGIDAQNFQQGGSVDAYGDYADDQETYFNLLATLCAHKEKLLGGSGHLVFWFSLRHYAKTFAALSEHFRVDPYPLVWHKSDNKGFLPDSTRSARRIYETAFLCSFGDRKILSAVANLFSAPVTRVAEHMSEKSQPMLQHFFRMFVDGDTRMLDPTCGSGSALRAARALGAKSVLGLERDAAYADNARRAFDAGG